MDGLCSRCQNKPAIYYNMVDMGGSMKVVAINNWLACHEEHGHSYVYYNLCEDCQWKLQEFLAGTV